MFAGLDNLGLVKFCIFFDLNKSLLVDSFRLQLDLRQVVLYKFLEGLFTFFSNLNDPLYLNKLIPQSLNYSTYCFGRSIKCHQDRLQQKCTFSSWAKTWQSTGPWVSWWPEGNWWGLLITIQEGLWIRGLRGWQRGLWEFLRDRWVAVWSWMSLWRRWRGIGGRSFSSKN